MKVRGGCGLSDGGDPLYLLPACRGGSSRRFPWDAHGSPAALLLGAALPAAPWMLFLSKRGRKMSTCTFPSAFPQAGGLVQAGTSRGFARLSQLRSCSLLCSGSPRRGAGGSGEGTGVRQSQRDPLALQH